jgi:hypothetical protein
MESDTSTGQQRTLEQLYFIRRSLTKRNELLRQVPAETSSFDNSATAKDRTIRTWFSLQQSSEHGVVYTLPDKLPMRASEFVPAVPVYPSARTIPAVLVIPYFPGMPVCSLQQVQNDQLVVHSKSFQMPVKPGSAGGMLNARDSADRVTVNMSKPSIDINLDIMPKYDGSKKRLHARFWLRSIEDMQSSNAIFLEWKAVGIYGTTSLC